MKNKNIIYIIVAVIAVIISIASLGIFYTVYKDIAGDKEINAWEELLNSKENKVLYFGRTGCMWCAKYKPVLEAIKNEYKVNYEYIDIDATKDIDELLARIGKDINTFATPYLAIVKNNKKINELSGYTDAKTTFEFFKNNGLIDKSIEYKEMEINESEIIMKSEKENYPNINFLTYNNYEKLLDSNGKNILIVGQITCGYSEQYKPIIDEVAKEKGITINYIDITSLNNEEYSSFIESLSYFRENTGWGTPLTLIIENGQVIDYRQGIRNKKDTITYLESLGLL